MTVTINGTTGITNDGGYTGDGVVFPDNTPANTLVTTTGGNVGIGTSSPIQKLEVAGTTSTTQATVTATTGETAFRLANTGGAFGMFIDNAAASSFGKGAYSRNLYSNGAYPLVFWTNDAERMRISDSGRVFIGQTSAALSERLGVTNSSGQAFSFDGSTGCGRFTNDDLNHYSVIFQSKAGTSATHFQIGFFNSAGSTVGNITHNNSNTTYATSSDYRLKENIAPMTGALAVVGQLKPCTYTWKATGETSQGFIAHELQAVVPDAVVGEKDAVNEDGSIKPQGIDTSFLVATLTAAIQEQQAIITDLKARIETLENK